MNDNLYYCFDCISDAASTQICANSLSSRPTPDGSKPFYSGFPTGSPPMPCDDAWAETTLGYTAMGGPFTLGGVEYPALLDHKEFHEKCLEGVYEPLRNGKTKVHTPDVRKGGLKGVLEGLDEMRIGKVSGRKLIYRVAETEA